MRKMACTTILVGKKASYDGSTMIARNDDSGSGHFTAKKFVVVTPEEQPKTYVSVLSHVKVELPEQAMRYTSMPNAEKGEGIWAASGVNEANVAMTATETITTNPRVQGADPLVVYQPAKDGQEEVPGGIGEEDIVCLVLPYIKSAREGVARLGQLLETYGTYENNGIAFQDADEIWWLETIGGHHWMARKVPDDVYVVMPNQFGIDTFDLEDALGEQKEYMCSPDLKEFIEKYHLDLSMDGVLNPRDAFGSHDDSDHVYNTPRAWYMERCLNPNSVNWDGPDADYTPLSDDIPWCMVPEKKITPEDVKYVLSAHYQGTPYDPYLSYGDRSMSGAYRSIGINRNDFMSLIQMRPEGGAAFGTLVAEAVVLVVQAAALKNMAWEIIKKVEVWKILPAAALSGAAMVFIKNKVNMPVFPVLVICFSVFFSIYGILLLGMKERILMELLRTAAKRLKQKEREE